MTEPNKLKKLGTRLAEEAEKVGLIMMGFSYAPNLGGGPDVVQAVFTLDEDTFNSDDEQSRFDKQFSDMMRAEMAETQRQQIMQARREIEENILKGEGFL